MKGTARKFYKAYESFWNKFHKKPYDNLISCQISLLYMEKHKV